MEINIAELKYVSEKLFGYLDEMDIKSIEVAVDYYWNIPEQDRYNVTKNPSYFTIGQVSSDWDELSNINSGKSEAFLYAFVWLASVTRAIGEVSIAEAIK